MLPPYDGAKVSEAETLPHLHRQPVCRIELLGWLRVQSQDRIITRFQTLKTGALLAYLACHAARPHPREVLVDTFWPDANLTQGRNRLKQALASLRRQLEPPGVPAGSVLFADRLSIGLHADAITTDVREFMQLLQTAHGAEDASHRLALLQAGVARYGGPLLPGYYEDWALRERERLQALYVTALCDAARLLEPTDPAAALDMARRAVAADPLADQAQRCLLRLYAITGQATGAARLRHSLQDGLETVAAPSDPPPSPQPLPVARETFDRASPPDDPQAYASPPSLHDLPSDADALSGPASHGFSTLPPRPRTRFFGRTAQVTELMAWMGCARQAERGTPRPEATLPAALAEARLVTLTGLGGSGKSRLALEAAHQAQQEHCRVVCFVPLAEVAASHLMEAIYAALRLDPSPQRPLLDLAAESLARQPALLVLDNFEHLLADTPSEGSRQAVALVQSLMDQAPHLLCLVTSRQRLHGEGEQEIGVAPLPVPPVGNVPERLLAFPSVQMFVDRAQKARVDFQVTARNAESIARICGLLEGLPLAIELAAAWALTLSPAHILARLQSSLELLVTQRRDGSPRQQSLRAVLEGSVRLLSPELRRFFMGLGVFRGGWTVEAAESVCQEPRALHLLLQLRERSLLVTEASDASDVIRYRMLEIVRTYTREERSADEALLAAHADYYTRLAEQMAFNQGAVESASALDYVEAEYDNLRAGMQWLLAHRPPQCLRLASALWRFWDARGYLREGMEWLTRALAQTAEAPPDSARAQALTGLGTLEWQQGRYVAAEDHHQEALRVWQALGDARGIAEALNNLAIARCHQNDFEAAKPLYEESLRLQQRLGNLRGMANCYNNLGVLAREQGRIEDARRCQEQGLTLRREINDRGGIAVTLMNLGIVALHQEEYAAAAEYFQESLALFRETGDKARIPGPLFFLAMLSARQGEVSTARQRLAESMAMYQELAEQGALSECLLVLTSILCVQERFSEAAYLLGALTAIRQTLRLPLSPSSQHIYAKNVAQSQERLAATFDSARTRGSALSLEQAVTFAHTILSEPDNAP